jgi:hypothetical protein
MFKTLEITRPSFRKDDGYTPEQNLTEWRKEYFIPSLAAAAFSLVTLLTELLATVSFVMYVCLSGHVEQIGSHWTDIYENWI